jgi:LytS/YehU family sensor histidine kinase
MVPPFLLQPIVENAVKHGIAPFARDGGIRIEARVTDGRLHVIVHDTGDQDASLATTGTGVGLQLTRRRLDTTFGTAYELSLDRQPSGTAVRIVMPLESAHAL